MRELGSRTALVMEALEDRGLEREVFADSACWVLADACPETLRPYLSALGDVYDVSQSPGVSPVATYLAGPRARVLGEHPLVAQTLGTLVPGLGLEDLVDREVLLPGGKRIPSLRALLGWLGQPLQLFNVLALLLLLGMGIDYGIFLLEHRGDRSAWLSVCVGAASTWLSFGLLALSSTPALRAFGLTLLLGIGLVWVITPLFRPPPHTD